MTASLGLTFVMSTASSADPIQLDLGSDAKTISVTSQQLQGQATTTIDNGGTGLTVTAGTNLTPAQYVALTQVISGGAAGQSITLDASGRAIGGTFNVATLATNQLGTLTIPSNVVAVASYQSSLNIAGNLVAAGTLLGTGSAGSTVNIQAGSINVLSTGSITTQVPLALQNIFSSAGPVNLNLTTTLGNIVNSGAITSSGLLNIVSAGSITNNTNAIVSGLAGANILSGSGIINNAGTIVSALGNINLTTLPGRDLLINNIAGNIIANQGNINVRDALNCTSDLTTIIGGSLTARQINLFGGDGLLTANVDNLSGILNVKAEGAHVSSLFGDLQIGTFELNGDPLLASLGGSLLVGSAQASLLQTSGQAVVLLAKNNVSISNVDVLTFNTTGDGGNVVIAAGYDIQLNDPNPLVFGDEQYVILGPSLEGGNIIAPNTRIISAGNPLGGAVQLSASGGTVNSGIIQLGTNFSSGHVIKTFGAGPNGVGGQLNITATSSIQIPAFVGAIDTNGALAPGLQNISIANPRTNSVSFAADGSLISGFFYADPITTGTLSPTPINGPLAQSPASGAAPIPTGSGNSTVTTPVNFNSPSGVIIATDSQNIGISSNNGATGAWNGSGSGYNSSNMTAPPQQGSAGNSNSQPQTGSGALSQNSSSSGAGFASKTDPHTGNAGGGTKNGSSASNAPNNFSDGKGAQIDKGSAIAKKPEANGEGHKFEGQVARGSDSLLHGMQDAQASKDYSTTKGPTEPVRPFGNISFDKAQSALIETTREQLRMSLITRSNQILSGNLGGRGNFMMGSEGTTFTNKQGVVILHTGRLHADTGPDGGTIVANGHKVDIAPNSSAVVDVDATGKVSVMAVGGEKSCTLAINKAASILVPQGEVVTVSDDLSSDDLIDAAGQSTPVSGGITHICGKKIVKSVAPVDRYLNEELAPATRTMNLSASARAGRNRFLAHVAMSARKQNPSCRLPHVGDASVENVCKNGTIDLYSREGTKLQQAAPDTINLISGMLLLRAPNTTTVKTDVGSITADKGALFAVEQQDGITRVRALSGPGDVTITAADKSLSLNPGEEMMLSTHALKRAELNPADGIGRRAGRHFKMSSAIYASVSDFSIASLINGDPNIRTFVSQHDDLFEGILKTAVAVEIVTASRGRYSAVPPSAASKSENEPAYEIAHQ